MLLRGIYAVFPRLILFSHLLLKNFIIFNALGFFRTRLLWIFLLILLPVKLANEKIRHF